MGTPAPVYRIKWSISSIFRFWKFDFFEKSRRKSRCWSICSGQKYWKTWKKITPPKYCFFYLLKIRVFCIELRIPKIWCDFVGVMQVSRPFFDLFFNFFLDSLNSFGCAEFFSWTLWKKKMFFIPQKKNPIRGPKKKKKKKKKKRKNKTEKNKTMLVTVAKTNAKT